jgi:preprotein translocase subunit SecA
MALDTILAKIFGTRNEREVKAMLPLVQTINGLEILAHEVDRFMQEPRRLPKPEAQSDQKTT